MGYTLRNSFFWPGRFLSLPSVAASFQFLLTGRLPNRISMHLGALVSIETVDFVGAPGEIRTPDPQIRSLVLYPAELRAPRLCDNGMRLTLQSGKS
jgi:hypothetical protein